ncbi:helix-turn-helix domain-containing protein [Wenzhouxiangella sp. XN24]|uniref:helix-turn-helix domain-containing protein n=1 Tax=Wenzhouxiangella sp. XN24 TaxID=2713569 RepID=UPI0013EC4B10|nr:helix-turn-helix domain-containing protein [Wenzhouxiangella sp. XN24]NGX16839.1 helix-turn-helix transcriptional regulator [Wenzhouxiangella sp. XN24]
MTTQATISEGPLIGLFGSESAYRVLMYLENYGQGYASQIAKTFGFSLSQVQNQLRKFEDIGLLVSRREATARVFYFRPSPITEALRAFLREMLTRLPPEVMERDFRERRRPRRFGKN